PALPSSLRVGAGRAEPSRAREFCYIANCDLLRGGVNLRGNGSPFRSGWTAGSAVRESSQTIDPAPARQWRAQPALKIRAAPSRWTPRLIGGQRRDVVPLRSKTAGKRTLTKGGRSGSIFGNTRFIVKSTANREGAA